MKFDTDKKSTDELAERGHQIANHFTPFAEPKNFALIHEMECIIYELTKRLDPTWNLGVVRQMPDAKAVKL